MGGVQDHGEPKRSYEAPEITQVRRLDGKLGVRGSERTRPWGQL